MPEQTPRKKADKPKRHPLTLVAYVADVWEHVCPTVRLTGPAEQAGLRVVKGNQWQDGIQQVYPERVSQGDIVLIQRNFPERFDEYEAIVTQARSLGKPVVYEFDDLLCELPEAHPDFYHYLSTRAPIIRAITEADAVVSSTPALCDYLRLFNPNVWLLPNYLDDRLWQLMQPSRSADVLYPPDDRLVIGYQGGHSHAYDLETITPALLHILDKYGSRISLKFWGIAPPPDLRDRLNVEWIDVGLVDYASFASFFVTQHCDIFIAPLQDNPFNRCKSHLKFLEYSALGVPGIYSRLTPYKDIVVHGQNGFLASTMNEWEECLALLIENPELRLQLGVQAQKTVRDGWLLSDHARQWLETYSQIYRGGDRIQKPAAAANMAKKLVEWQLSSDKQTQDLHRQLVSTKEQLKQLEVLKAEIETLKIQLADKDRIIFEYSQTAQHIHGLYMEVLNSRSWRSLQKLQRVRQFIIPSGSRRARLLRLVYQTPRVISQIGWRGYFKYAWQESKALARSALQGPLTQEAQPVLPVVAVTEGIQCSRPAISIIYLLTVSTPEAEVQVTQAWLQSQTSAAMAQLVLWDRSRGWAYLSDQSNVQWEAPDVRSLLQRLETRYICQASSDLLAQDATYLEVNLIALETEALVFTVNLRGDAAWAMERLKKGLLPGNDGQSLLRQIVARDYLGEDLTIDLSAWLEKRQGFPGVAGKLIQHTTNRPDHPGDLPFRQQLRGGEINLLGKSILARSRSEMGWNTITHSLHPVDTVIPALPASSDTPTVIIVMPFLAVGGAEQIVLKNTQKQSKNVRFIVVTCEPLPPELGTLSDAYRQMTPYVYSIPDFMDSALNLSFLIYITERFKPASLYIPNGTPWIYEVLGEIKHRYPDLRISNQVYDATIGWINRYDPSLVMYIDAHLAPNSKIRQAYIQKGVKPEQTYLIENGVEPAELNPDDYPPGRIAWVKARLGLPLDKKVVTFASRIHPQKRPMDFIELARRLSSDPSVVFLMVGDGPLANEVDEQINKIGLKNIHRHKFYRPISDILSATDVLVLPSDFEGMPMIFTEALAMGKPFVATDVGNNREVAERTKAGVVTQIGDIPALMKGIKQMLDAPPDPRQLRKVALSYWDIAAISEQFRQAILGDLNA